MNEPACPRCGAMPGVPCVTKRGNAVLTKFYEHQHEARKNAIRAHYLTVLKQITTPHGTFALTRGGITFNDACFSGEDDIGHTYRIRFENVDALADFAIAAVNFVSMVREAESQKKES